MRWVSRLWVTCLLAFAAPLSAKDTPTHYFVFELDEAKLAERDEGEVDLEAAMEAALDVAGKRLAGGDFELRNLGEGRIALTLTHDNAPQIARDTFGITAQLDFLLADPAVEQADLENGIAPPGTIILPLPDGQGLIALRLTGGLSGDRLIDARVSIDPMVGDAVINLRFDAKGKEQLAAMTSANVNERMAIVLDGEVLSAPIILAPILGGTAQISGSFTRESADQLAIALRSGALPGPFRLAEERVIELGS